MDGVLPTEEFMEEELVSLTHEHKVRVFLSRDISTEILSFLTLVCTDFEGKI